MTRATIVMIVTAPTITVVSKVRGAPGPGEVVGSGAEIDLRTIPGKKYVRAVVNGKGETVVGTQPFILPAAFKQQ